MSQNDFRRLRGSRVAAYLGALPLLAVAGCLAVSSQTPNPGPASPGQPAPTQQTAPNQPKPPQQNAPQPRTGSSGFTLDAESAAGNGSVSLTRPDTGVVSLNLLYSGTTAVNAQIRTTPFGSDSGGSITVDILSDCANPSSKQVQPVAVAAQPNAVIPLCLFVPPLPAVKAYSGRLVIVVSSGAPVVKTLSFGPPVLQQGTLVLDQTSASETVSRSWWPLDAGATEAEFSVRLREKTSVIALEGVTLRLEPVAGTAGNGLDLRSNLTFLLNGVGTDLDRYPPEKADPASRTIPAGAQLPVTIRVHDLDPGDYTCVLRFSALNSAADDAQKLQLSVHVRDSVWWAVAWLLLAVGISFVGTKVLTTLRRRASLLQTIRTLQPQWFSTLPPIPPVVWLRAVLHQTQKLSKQFWLTSPDLIEANLSDAQRMLAVLDNIRQVRRQLEIALDALAFRRVGIGLDRVLERLGTSPLNDAAIQNINTELAAFKDFLSDDKFPGLFWSNIQPALQSLENDMASGGPLPAQAQAVIDPLKKAISDALATPPTTRDSVEQVYQQYARLRILWDERDDIDALIGPAQADIVHFLALADQLEWNRIKGEQIQIHMPHATDVDGLEAYQVLQFSVTTSNPALDRSYLFRHKIEFQWHLRLTPDKTWLERHGWKRAPAEVTLQPVSLGPMVVQYFPRAGRVHAAVKMVYENEPKDIGPAAGPVIYPSSDFQPYKILEGTETASWLIAAITALATGLTMFYFKGTSWGTYQDYLTMLLWGMGVDQGKNFLQALQANSAPSGGQTAH